MVSVVGDSYITVNESSFTNAYVWDNGDEINNEENENLHDLDTRELVSVIPLLVLMLFIGVYPSFIESYVLNDAQIITNVVELFSGGLN